MKHRTLIVILILLLCFLAGCKSSENDEGRKIIFHSEGNEAVWIKGNNTNDNDFSDDDFTPPGDDDDFNDDDDDITPYWASDKQAWPVSMDIYRPVVDQGLNGWEWEAGMTARDALLQSSSVKWVATFDVDAQVYHLWHHDGEMTFIRVSTPDGFSFLTLDVVGPTPFENQDPMFGAGYEAELALFENPNQVQMTGHGYAPNDPRVGWVPDDENSYPHALKRITQIFDSPNGPDIAFGFHGTHGTPTGTHGYLDVFQSRACLILSGAGVKNGVVLEQAGDLVDIAPTVLALLGADVIEGIDHKGCLADNNFLTWQDGQVLVDAISDPSVKGLAEQVVVLLFDGLSPNELMYHYENQDAADAVDLPNFFEIIENGTVYRGGAIAGWPTVSWPGHTNMGTGTYQGHNGIVDNAIELRSGDTFNQNWFIDHASEILNDPDIALDYYLQFFHEERGVETLYQAVHRNFGDWELTNPLTWRHGHTSCLNELTFLDADYGYFQVAQLLSEFLTKDGKFDPVAYQLADFTVPIQFVTTLLDPTHQPPKLTLASFYETDHQGEAHGPHSNQVRQTLQTLDDYIGVLLSALKRRDLFESTAFIITSDHGMELMRSEVWEDYRPYLNSAGLKYSSVMLHSLLYLKVMRVIPDQTSVPADVPATITVSVLDDDTGFAIEGADLVLTGGDCTSCNAQTNAQGQATFTVTPSQGQDLVLETTHSDFSNNTITISVAL